MEWKEWQNIWTDDSKCSKKIYFISFCTSFQIGASIAKCRQTIWWIAFNAQTKVLFRTFKRHRYYMWMESSHLIARQNTHYVRLTTQNWIRCAYCPSECQHTHIHTYKPPTQRRCAVRSVALVRSFYALLSKRDKVFILLLNFPLVFYTIKIYGFTSVSFSFC